MNIIKIKCHLIKRNLIQNKHIQEKIHVPSVETQHMQKVSSVLLRCFSVKLVTSMEILQACVIRNKFLLSPECPRYISHKLDRCTCKKIPYVVS